MRLNKLTSALAIVGLASVSGAALATNGYFSHGYGMKAKGMAGASTAVTGDAFGGANNPATMVWAGDRLDIGVDLFSPPREISRTGSANGIDGSTDSDSNLFAIPEIGYNKMLNKDLSLGVSVYGNGGMNTDFPAGQITSPAGSGLCNFFQTGAMGAGTANYNLLCGNGSLGVDLSQLIIAPTVAYKFNQNHSIGISPLIGYQRFKAEGLQAFVGLSSDAANLTNRGYDDSFGYGVRVGYYGKLSDSVSIGAAYASKMNMQKFDKYKGLFAEQGGFDLPENYNVGIAIKATPTVLIALDYQHISYSGINSVSNPSTNAFALGTNNGRGFGWEDVDVFKLGVEWQATNTLTLRGGYSRNSNPIQSRDVTFNFLAPAVGEEHYSVGATYALSKDSGLTAQFTYQPENSVTGNSLFTSLGAGASGTETIKIYQRSFGVSYSVKF